MNKELIENILHEPSLAYPVHQFARLTPLQVPFDGRVRGMCESNRLRYNNGPQTVTYFSMIPFP